MPTAFVAPFAMVPVATFSIETPAPGVTAPDGSTTRPETVAHTTWAESLAGKENPNNMAEAIVSFKNLATNTESIIITPPSIFLPLGNANTLTLKPREQNLWTDSGSGRFQLGHAAVEAVPTFTNELTS